MHTNTVIILLRHAKLDNPQNLFYERGDTAISNEGIDETIRTSQELKRKLELSGRRLEFILHSPLPRAQQTAEIYAAELGLHLQHDKRLIERGSSGLIGKSITEIEGPCKGDLYNNPNKDYEIEMPEEIANRMEHCLRGVLESNRGQTVGLLSHGDPLDFLWERLTHPDQGIRSVIDIRGDGQAIQKSEARILLFDPTGKLLEHELIRVPKEKESIEDQTTQETESHSRGVEF